MKWEQKETLRTAFYYYHKIPESRIKEFAERAKIDAKRLQKALEAGVKEGAVIKESFKETYYALPRRRKRSL